MKKNRPLCPCGSGKTKERCCKKGPQVRVWMKPFENPKERQQFLMDLAISAQFEMCPRGLHEFYGKDLIAYKLEKPTDESRNDFLRVFSKFMTDNLEDSCPTSWKQCQSSFWEEFIFDCIPQYIKITPQEKEIEKYLFQLKKFTKWLDHLAGTSSSPVFEAFAEEAASELKNCERLLNHLFLMDFPKLHQADWNLQHDYEKIEKKFNQFTERLSSLFEVTSIIEDIVVLTEFNTNNNYYVKGLPYHLIEPGMIMSGAIGKRLGVNTWNWYETEGIYPKRGKKYARLVM